MLSTQGILEVSRTGRPATVGAIVVTVDDLIRWTKAPDWVGGAYLRLTHVAARRLAQGLDDGSLAPRTVARVALSSAPEPIDAEVVSVVDH